ncbi:MAG: hypothetical protein IPK68_19770 [Bdellovibrionales bacterium]|nr:hypothetical protein [Bdellovibrionales bacterium]
MSNNSERIWNLIWRLRGQLTVALILIFLPFLFQNCGDVNFQSIPLSYNAVNANFGSITPKGALTINKSAEFTNNQQVRLEIMAQGATSMALENGLCPDPDKASWQDFNPEVSWSLADNDGNSQVHLLLKGKTGTISSCISAAIVLDREVPLVQVSNGPRNLENTAMASFLFHATDEVSGIDRLYCQNPGSSTFVECNTETELQNLAEGSHGLSFYVTDKAGNRSALALYSWSIDLTPPTVQIVAPLMTSPLTVKAGAVSFQGADQGGAGILGFYCSLDNVEISNCSSPALLQNLSEGTHTFRVKAIDKVGWESAVSEYQFIVDTQPSGLFTVLGITGGIDTKIDNYLSVIASPNINWTKSAGAQSYQVSVLTNDLSSTICGPLAVVGEASLIAALPSCSLADGSNYVARVSAYRNGFEQKAPDFPFTVDASGPIINIVSSTKSDELKKINIQFRISDIGSGLQNATCYKTYQTTDLASTDCTTLTSIEYANLIPGTYQFYIKATDRLGHESQSQTVSFIIGCPPGQSIVDGICQNTAFTECREFVELDTTANQIVIPSLAETGKCYYKKIISAVNHHSSGSAGELRAMDVLSRDHNSSSATPSHPFVLGESQLTFLVNGPRIVSLSSTASADGSMSPLKIDNFFLVEFTPQGSSPQRLARGTADAQPWTNSNKTAVGPILVNNQPVNNFQSYASGGTALVPYIDVSGNFQTGVPTTVRVRQLDCGGSAEASNVFLIIR